MFNMDFERMGRDSSKPRHKGAWMSTCCSKIKSIAIYFSSRHGSKKGYARAVLARVLYSLGLYPRRWARLNSAVVHRVIFVCKGNVCRSAYAKAKAAPEFAKSGIHLESFGLVVKSERGANAMAMKVASERGVDLSSHRSASVENLHPNEHDLLVAFEPWQARLLEKRFVHTGAQITLAGLFVEPVLPHIEDPYGYSSEYFAVCFERIDRAIAGIAQRLSERK